MKIEFSIIIPVFHGGNFLHSTLSSAHEIDFPADCFEVLVAGPNTDEDSRRIVESVAADARFHLAYFGCASSRRSIELNTACAMARGRILAFIDDDCLLIADWLKQLSQAMGQGPGIGAVGGVDKLESTESTFDVALDCVLSSPLVTGHLFGRKRPGIVKYYPKLYNMAIPRSVALEVALGNEAGMCQIFNQDLAVHEDVDLGIRIERSGKQLVFAPQIRIAHYRDTNFLSFVMRNLSLARACRHLGVHRLPQTLLSIFTLGALILTVLSVFLPVWQKVLLVCLTIYLCAVWATSLSGCWRRRKFLALPMIPVLLVSLHFTRGLGYLFTWSSWRSKPRPFGPNSASPLTPEQ